MKFKKLRVFQPDGIGGFGYFRLKLRQQVVQLRPGFFGIERFGKTLIVDATIFLQEQWFRMKIRFLLVIGRAFVYRFTNQFERSLENFERLLSTGLLIFVGMNEYGNFFVMFSDLFLRAI